MPLKAAPIRGICSITPLIKLLNAPKIIFNVFGKSLIIELKKTPTALPVLAAILFTTLKSNSELLNTSAITVPAFTRAKTTEVKIAFLIALAGNSKETNNPPIATKAAVTTVGNLLLI